MQKSDFIISFISLILSTFDAYAQINCYDNFDPEAGCLSATNDSGTVYYSIDNGKMTVYGPSQKDENGDYISSAEIPDNAFANVIAQWVKRTTIPEVTDVKITGNITSIGDSAFWRSNITNIDIPDTVTEIKSNAFCSAENLDTIVIPESVTIIGYDAFDGITALGGTFGVVIKGDSITIPGRLTAYPDGFTLYCKQGVDACENKADDVRYYVPMDNGFYQIDDKLYATADLMTHNAACDDAANCQVILDAASQGKPFEVGGKYYATLDLFANGAACTDKKNCEDILSSNGNPFKVGSKIYNSMADFANGNYVKHRIYTIEEANFVAGEKNRVSIKYR